MCASNDNRSSGTTCLSTHWVAQAILRLSRIATQCIHSRVVPFGHATIQEFDAFKEEGLSSSAPLHEGLDVASDPLLGLSGPPRSTPTVPEVVRVRAALERCIQVGGREA
jgi:hypothetical protein